MIRVSIPIRFVALLVLCGSVGAQEAKRLAVPPTIVDPPWMAERRAAQLAAEQLANGTPQLPPVSENPASENPATPTSYEPG